MDWRDLLNRFQLYDNQIIYEQINAIAMIQMNLFVNKGQRLLLFNRKTLVFQLVGQASFIG